MPHVAVYQSGNTTSIAGASSGPNAHLGLSLLVFFCINPPFGKFTQIHHSKKVVFFQLKQFLTFFMLRPVFVVVVTFS